MAVRNAATSATAPMIYRIPESVSGVMRAKTINITTGTSSIKLTAVYLGDVVIHTRAEKRKNGSKNDQEE